MPAATALASASRRRLLRGAATGALLVLTGCATLGRQAPRVTVAGIEPLAGQGLEMRFDLRLRVQNPNDAAIDFTGIALDLDLNGRTFASGVSDQGGSIPGFGERVVSVPITVSAMSAVRQFVQLAEGRNATNLRYALRGRLAGGTLGGTRFSDTGTLTLPGLMGG